MGKPTNQNNRKNISNSRRGSPRKEKHSDNNGRGHYSQKMRRRFERVRNSTREQAACLLNEFLIYNITFINYY